MLQWLRKLFQKTTTEDATMALDESTTFATSEDIGTSASAGSALAALASTYAPAVAPTDPIPVLTTYVAPVSPAPLPAPAATPAAVPAPAVDLIVLKSLLSTLVRAGHDVEKAFEQAVVWSRKA